MEWLRHMYDEARSTAVERGYGPPPFDEFWEKGSYHFPLPPSDGPLLAEYVEDPVANRLKTPSGRIEIFSEKVDSFGYDDCPGHPTWLEPEEWLGSPLARRFPFHLLSNQPSKRLHSQLDASPESRKTKIKGREPIEIGRADATARGFKDGDIVRVFNDRGATLAGVRVVDDLLGVVMIATGAWYDPEYPGHPGSLEKHGNPNVLTLDKGASQSRSPLRPKLSSLASSSTKVSYQKLPHSTDRQSSISSKTVERSRSDEWADLVRLSGFDLLVIRSSTSTRGFGP